MNNEKTANRLVSGLRTAAIILAATVVAVGCSAPPPEQSSAVANLQNRPIKVATITQHSMSEPKEQVAEVSAAVQIDVLPKTGGQVLQVLKRKGESVQQGEVIARLDSRDAQLQVQKVEQSLKSAEESLRQSIENQNNSRIDLESSLVKVNEQVNSIQQEYNKVRNDFEAGTVTKRQVDQVETQLNNARLDVQSVQNKIDALDKTNPVASQESQLATARISLQDAGNTVANYEVKAPITGVLTDMSAEVGMNVSPSAKIGLVQQLDPIKIKADLTENSVKLVGSKQELIFYSADNPANKQTAKITFLASQMNDTTKAYPIELDVANPDGSFKPGTRVQLQLTSPEEEQALAVPSLSIVREGSDAFVFILNGDQVEKRKIKIGRIKDAFQEVVEGLKAEESIVVSGQHQLKDGQKVEVAK
ncbi:efflux RND transporter periplasmic adaptor subunit [Paenibacillus agricola]|uniref:Efflux RND transporter periplasmic adaptor subunit n=1 Tax=Paenibacillus agricola TaxID=2716264 RepID=A0ABX0J0Z8_9BACL|nr:efflux RND transporter periplasmic adaptor subunit [Paenibacillus agricola]NHN29792.1 efflux RND transporter periplasmic adaptor subunit [Paenibacillus agricola]